LLGGGALADRQALPNSGLAVWLDRGSGLARGFDHRPTRPPKGKVPLASPVALTVGRLSPDRGALPVVLTAIG